MEAQFAETYEKKDQLFPLCSSRRIAVMNFEYFFARRITLRTQRKASTLTVRLAIISIALAVATMEIALSFVQGFETEIQKKVVGFGSHIHLGTYFRQLDTEIKPLPKDEESLAQIRQLPGVVSLSPYVEMAAALKSKSGWDGVRLKGVDGAYDWHFFQQVLKDGYIPQYDRDIPTGVLEILISRKQSRRLSLNTGDKAVLLFIAAQENFKRRPVTVAGIYETGMEEFDNNVVICDMRLLQDIWGWESNEVGGFEVNLTSLDLLDLKVDQIKEMLPYRFDAEPITMLYPEIFDWLNLQHQNVWVILFLMIIVAVINMTTVVLILIIERTRTVGILKAIGLPNHRVRRMFVWNAFFLILFGVVAGNLLGLGLLASQDAFGWLRVNQEDYFIEQVPVAWVWTRFLLINLGTIASCTFFMLVPTIIINRISPVVAIRFK
jgi:lipoprotein-releasing system permease protein